MLTSKSKVEKIFIGTRASKLALAQSNEIKKILTDQNRYLSSQLEICKITTSGDKIKDVSLADIGGKGLFIKELEECLIDKKIDVAVHSAKDVPPVVHKDTEIIAFTPRRDVRDYFISNKFASINDLPLNAVVGTSSARRKAILLKLRPDLDVINFRGNVDTRLKKLEKGDVDATILAVCGLERLAKEIDITKIISPEIMLPSVGQGSVAIQIRKDDLKLKQIFRTLNDDKSEICISAERNFLRILRASCRSPISVYCNIEDKNIRFRSIIYDFDGKEYYQIDLRKDVSLYIEDVKNNHKNLLDISISLSIEAANQTRKNALELLERICR